jgi:hypothetical protein
MMRVTIADDQEREELFAEIHYDDFQWAELIFEPKSRRFLLTVFPPTDREQWTFTLREAEQAIGEARAALEARGYHERE